MKYFVIALCIFIAQNLSAQTTFTSDDYPETGSLHPKIKYLNNPGDIPAFVSDFYDGNSWDFSSVDDFSQYVIDTVNYLNPEDHDTAGNFPNATHMMRDGNQDIFIVKTEQKADATGFSGDMFEMGMNLPVAGETPLTLMKFPTSEGTSFTDNTYGERAMLFSDFEEVLPPDYYDQYAQYIDSVKIMLTMEIESDVVDEPQVTVDLPSAMGGTYDCLEEHRLMITEIDIYVRIILTGDWMPLGEVAGDNLPMELPYIDTSNTINLWNPAFSTPFVEIETNASHDTVFATRFNYNGQSGIDNKNITSFEVYPNPANEQFHISLDNTDHTVNELQIVNSAGKIVKNVAVNTKFFIFACDNLPAGWYIINVLNKQGTITGSEKLLIVK
ncbi:MAG: T9SS type A sorting domain-containing protein [Bacteroidota bacterium]